MIKREDAPDPTTAFVVSVAELCAAGSGGFVDTSYWVDPARERRSVTDDEMRELFPEYRTGVWDLLRSAAYDRGRDAARDVGKQFPSLDRWRRKLMTIYFDPEVVDAKARAVAAEIDPATAIVELMDPRGAAEAEELDPCTSSVGEWYASDPRHALELPFEYFSEEAQVSMRERIDARQRRDIALEPIRKLRREAGARIDPSTAKVWFLYDAGDHYGDFPPDPANSCVGRAYFAADPIEMIAVSFDDLPEATGDALYRRRDLGIESEPDGAKLRWISLDD